MPGLIYNGVADWLYEEEIFGRSSATWVFVLYIVLVLYFNIVLVLYWLYEEEIFGRSPATWVHFIMGSLFNIFYLIIKK